MKKLRCIDGKEAYETELAGKLEKLPKCQNIEDEWNAIKETIIEVADKRTARIVTGLMRNGGK